MSSLVNLSGVRTRFRQLPGPARAGAEGVVLVIVAVVLALFIKTFFVQAFYVPSPSMYPTLQGGHGAADRILVEKPSYWFGGPQRGDIVVFKDPGNWLSAEESATPTTGLSGLMAKVGLFPGGGPLVKRVIGIGGDVIQCCDKTTGRLIINGALFDESGFLPSPTADPMLMPSRQCDGPEGPGCSGWTVTVPQGTVFVMGDNRSVSADSAYHLCSPTTQASAEKGNASAIETCARAFVPVDDIVGKVVAILWPANRFTFLQRPAAFASIPAPKA